MVKFGAFAAFGLLSLVSQTVAAQTVKIMPFGASVVSVSIIPTFLRRRFRLTHSVEMLAFQPPDQTEEQRCQEL